MVNIDRAECERFGKILVGLENVERGVAIECIEIDGFQKLFATFCEAGEVVELALRMGS